MATNMQQQEYYNKHLSLQVYHYSHNEGRVLFDIITIYIWNNPSKKKKKNVLWTHMQNHMRKTVKILNLQGNKQGTVQLRHCPTCVR